MSHNKKACGKTRRIAWILVIIGALNWGLVGLGEFIGSNLNLVDLLLGTWPVVESVVYVLVGLSAILSLKGCKKCKDGSCGACANGTCDTHGKSDTQM